MCRIMFLLMLSVALYPLYSEEPLDRKKIVQVVEKLSQQQEALIKELASLKVLLGIHDPIQGLDIMIPKDTMETQLLKKIKEGVNLYKEAQFSEAKKAFQEAWEQDPNLVITNFNLGLAYHRLANLPLAKKMLKAATEIQKTFDGSDIVEQYLSGIHVAKKEVEETDAEKTADTQLTNLKKEAESYVKSASLNYSQRVQKTLKTLDEMSKVTLTHDKLAEKYSMDISESYAVFGRYSKAKELLSQYEQQMKGKVLPDGFHEKMLEVEQKEKKQRAHLSKYLNYKLSALLKKKLKRDLYELDIFTTQMEEFVKETDPSDADFSKICQRLGEYRWANRPHRHVIVTNRYQELLYSSLPGTLSLERYEDAEGRKFFQDLALLSHQFKQKVVKVTAVDLKLHGKKVPYVLLYAYTPKRDTLIIVRIPKGDLTS